MTRKPDSASQQPDEDLSAEEIRQLRRRLLRRRLVLFGLPSLFAIAMLAALVFPRLKEWRARQFAARAVELLAAGKLQEAFNNAASAIQVRRDAPEALRAYATVLFAAGKPEGIAVLQELLDSGRATAQDRLELAEASLRFNDVPLAEKQAFHLLQHGERTPDALFVLARVRLAQRRTADAMQALQESLEAGGGADAAILLARLRFAANTPESIKSATDLLRPFAARKDTAGLSALLTLLASPAVNAADARTWIEGVRTHPFASDEQKLAAASVEFQIDPSSYPEVVKRTVSEYRDRDIDQRAQVARWLNQNREYATALEVITAQEATNRSDLFLIRLDSMAGRGDWKEIAQLLRGDNLPLQAPVVLLYRGRAARENGEADAAAAYYRRSIIEAAPTPELMWYVINYLQRVGEEQVLEQELRRLTENPATARQAFQALVPIVQKRQDAEELYQLYERMLKILPADQIVQNDHRYFAALTGRRADTSGARELVASEPQMLAYRITLSLTLLKNGQPDAALRVFDGITLDPAQIQPYQRAVLAAVLGANGRVNEARQLARGIPGDAITTQEFELVTQWRSED